MGGVFSGVLGLGSNGAQEGAGYQAQGAPITSAYTNQQATDLYNQAQGGIGQQQSFVNALNGQNGIANQSNVYNQLQGVANGTGPNPAQTALANATGANVANQASLMAGQRGAGSNVGLIARQAAMQGANTQQQAAGQGANMQANQSLNALGQMGGLATTQVGQQQQGISGLNQGIQNEQGSVLGSIANANNANVSLQNGKNAANAGIAGINAQGQQQMTSGIMEGAGSALSSVAMSKGGQVPQGYAAGGSIQNYEVTGGQNSSPYQSKAASFLNGYSAGGQNVQAAQGTPGVNITKIGQLFSPQSPKQSMAKPEDGSEAGGAKTSNQFAPVAESLAGGASDPGTLNPNVGMMAARGGKVPHYDDGGDVMPIQSTPSVASPAPKGGSGGGGAASIAQLAPLLAAFNGAAPKKKVPAMVSPGEIYLPPKKAQAVAKGKESPMSGERIPGKAKVKGDSLKNDTVPKTLEAGGVVIPRSIMMAENAPGKAAAFVAAHMSSSQGLKRGKSK